MKKSGAYVKVNKVKQVLSAIGKLPQMEVLVGYPSDDAARDGVPPVGKNQRQPEPGQKQPDLTNSAIGYIMEYGAPEANIPARPHVMPGILAAKPKIVAYWKQAGKAALAGEPQKLNRILHAIGLTAQASIRDYITNGSHLPLATATLANRLAHGRTGTKPLLDTSQMRNAVSYVLRRRLVKQT